MKLHLKSGRLIDPAKEKDTVVDLLIVDGKIERIGKSLAADRSYEAIDLKNKVVAPGFIDMHVHLREPGYEHKETIRTGCASAAAGGFTAVCCMPNTNPAIDEESVARYVQEEGRQVTGGLVDVYPIAAATKGRKGEELSPMAELSKAGAVGFSDDGSPISNAEIMRRIFEYSSMYGIPVIQHAEELTMTKNAYMNEGFVATRLGIPGIPPIAEELMIQRDIILLRYIPKSKYHVAHVSTAGSVECVRRAKAEKLNITCEVTPHHFTLTDDAVASFDTNLKINPPLRTKDDVKAIKEALRDGTIDVIVTDHAPHTIDEKEVEFAQAPFGIVGLETALGLAVTELVNKKFLTLSQLIEKFSVNPRRILSLPVINIQEGEAANLTVFDPEKEWVVDIQAFKSKSKNSPFHGRKLKGKAVGTVNNGKSWFEM
ncbi:MAG: dihydroorotase [Bacteroidetes bacterium]|nr:dihydroorotase [Bacteroidota bacterium]